MGTYAWQVTQQAAATAHFQLARGWGRSFNKCTAPRFDQMIPMNFYF
jgi:hypothetical protein